jgi:uncharacterized OB-fold protein
VNEYAKPLPSLDDEVTAPYWAAAIRHRLTLPRCGDCGGVFFYPRRFCPACWSERVEWIESPGAGTVWSLTFVRVPFYDDTWAADVPYCVAIVELDEGVRLVTNIVGVEPGDVDVGDPVRVVFDDVTPEVTLPKFEVAR